LFSDTTNKTTEFGTRHKYTGLLCPGMFR